jgi:Myb-like DNA-binding domain
VPISSRPGVRLTIECSRRRLRSCGSCTQTLSSSRRSDSEPDSESDDESDGSYIASARHQNKQPGRRRCHPRSTSNFTPPSCSGATETASNVISDIDPECLELPIQGTLGIRIIGSETFYTLNFRQDPCRQNASPGRHSYTEFNRGLAGKSGGTPRLPGKKFKFTPEEDESLVELKGRRGLSWKEIEAQFPGRSAGTLQVHYSTKLKARARTVGKRRGRRCRQ